MARPLDDDAPFDVRRHDTPEARRALRARAEEWAVARGHTIVPEGLRFVVEGVEVIAVFSIAVREMCTLHATAQYAEPGRLQIEPKSWRGRLAERLGAAIATDDEEFDRRWHVESDREALVRRLLDNRLRSALASAPVWSRLVYVAGAIDVLLDSGSVALTGAHLLAGVEVAAVAAGRAVADAGPYR